MSPEPFSAAQAMAAFNQRNGTQGQQLLSQGLTKEQANQQSAQAFSAAVQAANPQLDFSKRNLNNFTGMVDPYQQAEDYYRRYGTGMPQTPSGSVGVDPVTGILFDSPVGAIIASQQVGDGGLSTEKPSVFPGTQSKEVNSAASQLAAMSRPQTITGSPFGGTNTRQSLYQQPMQQAAPIQQAQQPFAPVNFNSVLPRTFSPPAFSTEPDFPSGNFGNSGRTGSPQMQSAFNAGGNSGAIPLEGKIGIVKLAAGGEPKDYLTLGQREEAKSQDALGQAFTSGGLNAYLAALNASSSAPSTPALSTPAPSTSTSSPAPVVPPGYFEQEAQRQRDQAVMQEQARGNAASQQAISTGTPLNYTPAPVDLDAISVQQPASLAATSTSAPTWSTQQVADAGTFIAKHLNDPAKIEAKRKEIEQATGRDISVSDILAASKAANLSVSGALADIWSGDKYGPMTTQDYYRWINQGVMERPEFSGQEAQAAMKRFGISGEDITRARALDPRFSAGAQFALTTPTYEESGKTGFAALNQKLRDYIQQNAGAIKPEQARERLTQMLAAGTLTGGQALNEYDVQRATGKTLDELFKEATKPKPFVPPPPINIPAAPSRPVNKIDVPGIDTAFRESPVRTFNPATGTFQYTNPTKLAPATGSGTTWVPPVITSRQRQLLNVGFRDDITTPTYDAVSNMLYQPAASSSQRFAADRSAQMRALQQLRTSVPMGSSTFLQLQSRLRSGEFGGVGGSPVDAAALEAAAKGYAAPTTKVATIGDKYFEKYPDVAETYAKLDAATKAQFRTPSDYAQYHYDTYGRAEGREMPPLFAHGGPVVKKQSGGDVSRGTSSPNTAEVPQVDTEGRLIDENAEMRSESQRMLNRLKTAQQEGSRRGKLPPKNDDAEQLRKGIRESIRALVGMGPYDETNPTEAYRIAATPTPLAAVGMMGRKGLLGILDKAKSSTAFKGRGLDVAEAEQFSVKELMNRLKEQGIDVDRTWLRGKKDTNEGFKYSPKYDYLEALYEYQKRPDAFERALKEVKTGRPWSYSGTLSRQSGDRDVTKYNTKGGVWLTESPTIAESYSGDKGFIIPVLTRRPDVVLDAKGEQWDEFFKTSKEFKEAQRDPNIKSVEVKNIIDFGGRSKLPSGLSDDELRELLTANNLFLKKPFVDKDVVSKLTGEPFPYQDGGPVNVPRETSTSKQQLDKLAQVSQRKKA